MNANFQILYFVLLLPYWNVFWRLTKKYSRRQYIGLQNKRIIYINQSCMYIQHEFIMILSIYNII